MAMRNTFFRVAKTDRPNDPLMKSQTLPSGQVVKTIRRGTYERAIEAASQKLRERIAPDCDR